MEVLQQEQVRSRYLQGEKSVRLEDHLQKLEAEKNSGLNGVEIRDKAKELGKNDFLKLLLTQLSHQDPTEPVKDEQFIAQMAQFSSLEQMQNIASGISKMSENQSVALVGKFITGKDAISGQPVAGIASALFHDEGGRPLLRVGRGTVAVTDVELVGEPSHFKKEFGGTGGIGSEPADEQRNPAADLPGGGPGPAMRRVPGGLGGRGDGSPFEEAVKEKAGFEVRG